jgi:hypothetical protein
MRRLAVAVLCLLAFAGCNSKDNNKSEVDAATTVSTAPTTSTSTTIPSGPAQTPQAAADGLYNAWTEGDTQQARDDASRFGKPQAISKLFAHPYAPGTAYDRQPCTPQGGQFNCAWTYEGGSMQMTVENWPGGGFVVDSVIWVAD